MMQKYLHVRRIVEWRDIYSYHVCMTRKILYYITLDLCYIINVIGMYALFTELPQVTKIIVVDG